MNPKFDKKSISKSNLRDCEYIICKPTLTTGYDWWMLEDENGKIIPEHACIIIGVDPVRELGLKYDFISSSNKYVFYIAEKKVYFSEELGEDVIEYTAYSWDILFPVKHGNPIYDILYPFGIVSQDMKTPE